MNSWDVRNVRLVLASGDEIEVQARYAEWLTDKASAERPCIEISGRLMIPNRVADQILDIHNAVVMLEGISEYKVIPKRRHKCKRIQKKWYKQYGTKMIAIWVKHKAYIASMTINDSGFAVIETRR